MVDLSPGNILLVPTEIGQLFNVDSSMLTTCIGTDLFYKEGNACSVFFNIYKKC